MNTSLFLRHLFEFGVILPAAVMALLPVRGSFRFPSRLVFTAAGCITLLVTFAGSALCTAFDLVTNLVLLPSLAVFFCLYCLTVDVSISKKLFCFFTATMLCAFCSMYTNFLMGPVEQGNTSRVFLLPSGAVAFGITCFILLLFWQTLGIELPYLLENEYLNETWRWLFLFPFLFTLLFIWMTPLDPEVIMQGRIRIITIFFFPLIPLMILFLFHMLWWVTIKLTGSARLQQENDLLKMEEKRYDELLSYMEASRALRHDFRQHLLVILNFVKNGEQEKLMTYLQPLLDAADAKNPQLCKNKAVDSVASHYARLAGEREITLHCQLDLPETLPFPEMDICAILGNLIENAINAVSALPPEKRTVYINACMFSDALLGITVKNPYTGEIKLGKNGLPLSSRRGHGVGFASISSTVNRYGGTIELSTENGVFSVGVMLYAQV